MCVSRLQRWRGSCPLRSTRYGTISGRRVCQQASTWRDWRLSRLRWALVWPVSQFNYALRSGQLTFQSTHSWCVFEEPSRRCKDKKTIKSLKSNILVVTKTNSSWELLPSLGLTSAAEPEQPLVGCLSTPFLSSFNLPSPPFLLSPSLMEQQGLEVSSDRCCWMHAYVAPGWMTETRIALVFFPLCFCLVELNYLIGEVAV